jgi:hypothetical protein
MAAKRRPSESELRHHIQYIAPHFEENCRVLHYYRLHAARSVSGHSAYIQELFEEELDLYYSILPTATPYSRNSIFSGLLPSILPNVSRILGNFRRNGQQPQSERTSTADEHIVELGYQLEPSHKYVKIFNMEEGNFVLRKIDTWNKEN